LVKPLARFQFWISLATAVLSSTQLHRISELQWSIPHYYTPIDG